jgi:hypothetical protein
MSATTLIDVDYDMPQALFNFNILFRELGSCLKQKSVPSLWIQGRHSSGAFQCHNWNRARREGGFRGKDKAVMHAGRGVGWKV